MNNAVVSSNAELSVTNACEQCGATFERDRRKRFCSNACRQAAYRKSAAYTGTLAKKKEQRLRRRNAYFKRRYRFKTLFLGCHSGPIATDVPRLGMLDLKNY
jgi:hypothetical protein